MENVKLFIEKLGTVLSDRRGWVMGLVVLLLALTGYAGIPPELQLQIKESFGETYTASQGLIAAALIFWVSFGKLAALVVVAWKLIGSWTDRPPSGLRFHEIAVPPLATSVASSTYTSAVTESAPDPKAPDYTRPQI